jgi:DNA repair exonuclease SbcCD ATPase subunit
MTATLEQIETMAERSTTPATQMLASESIAFPVAVEQIAELSAAYMPLAITDVNNTEQFEAVHKARMVMVKLRTGLDKERKKLNEDAKKRIDKVNGDAKKLFELMAPIESHLDAEENKVKEEKKRIAIEEEEKRQAMITERCRMISECDAMVPLDKVSAMSSGEFGVLILKLRADKAARDEKAAADAAEQARIAEVNRIEAEKLAAERAELKRQRKEQEATAAEAKRIEDDRIATENARLEKIRLDQLEEQRKIDAEKKRIADADAARQREVELENAKREAAEKAVRDAEEKRQREAAQAKAKADADEAERKRQEQLRPDREKLLAVEALVDAIKVPDVSPAAEQMAIRVRMALQTCSQQIINAVSPL